jgi:ATP-dependent helicase/nuclease subunit B
MYDWLNESLSGGDGQVVTGNRRLARALRVAFGEAEVAAGKLAWASPAIFSWDAWIVRLSESLIHGELLPARLDDTQARVLWESGLAEDLRDPFLNIPRLAKQCMAAWKVLHEWRVPPGEWQSRAVGQDQRIFARAAGRYAAALAAGDWIDSAGLPDLIAARIASGDLRVPRRIAFCGFDRMTPQASTLLEALADAGAEVRVIEPPKASSAPILAFESPEAELRAAGAWASARLAESPRLRVAVIANRLDSEADRVAALVREGAAPGWQYGPDVLAETVNVSYGRRLGDYPAVAAGLLALRLMFTPLRGRDISLLLRSRFIGPAGLADRCRFELALRDQPDRDWTLSLLARFLRGSTREEDYPSLYGWLEGLEGAWHGLDAGGARRKASDWAQALEAALATAGWPGADPLSSGDYQLENRWRQLLNDFGRLDSVSAAMSGAEAVARLSGMARDAVFQPEQDAFSISLLGPLEAAGMTFDALWLSGATSEDWPSAGRPLALVSREVQRDYSMPDATPEDTTAFARDVIRRLAGSATEVIATFAATVADAEQLPTSLLAPAEYGGAQVDPGWHALSLAGSMGLEMAADRVPPVARQERIAGGAYTIQCQRQDPFTAFARGRLGIRIFSPFVTGIAANIRGNLVHAALQHLYAGGIGRSDLERWSQEERESRIDTAVRRAFRHQHACADDLLGNLLAIEETRTRRLLHRVLACDLDREPFVVSQVEPALDASLGELGLRLRCDRIDRDAAGGAVVLDYKTGNPRRLAVRGEIRELQVVVYSCVLGEPVTGLGLYNVDSRGVAIDGAGPAFGDDRGWPDTLRAWQGEVLRLAAEIAAGDARLNVVQSRADARPLSVLSRFPEVQHEY